MSQRKPQNCTSGHVAWSFDNNAEKFLPESIELPLKVQKKEPKKKFISIYFSENVDLDTQNPALKNLLNFSGKTQVVSVPRRKKMAKFVYICFEKTIFLQNAAIDT